MKTSDFRIGDIVSVDNLTECKVIEIKEKHLRVEYIRKDTQLPHRPLIEIERISPVKHVKFTFHDDEIKEGIIVEDEHFAGGYKVIHENCILALHLIKIIEEAPSQPKEEDSKQ